MFLCEVPFPKASHFLQGAVGRHSNQEKVVSSLEVQQSACCVSLLVELNRIVTPLLPLQGCRGQYLEKKVRSSAVAALSV
jgi:hypothetical protein